VITPRWHLQEHHDTKAPLPPDPRILGFHPEYAERPGTATSTPSRKERLLQTPPSCPKGNGFPGESTRLSTLGSG
jgi:hypothetical protein